MKTISINALSAAHEVASVIEGYGETLVLRMEDATVQIHPLGQYNHHVDLRLEGEEFRTARVEIEVAHRDLFDVLQRSRVSWSSSSSGSKGREDAVATATLLAFAAQIAATIDDWAERGQLSRLAPPEDGPKVDDMVDVRIDRVGPPNQAPAGTFRGVVLNAGSEYDVALFVDEDDETGEPDVEEIDRVLRASGADMTAGDLVEPHSGRFVLRNVQAEQLKVVREDVA